MGGLVGENIVYSFEDGSGSGGGGNGGGGDRRRGAHR